MTELAGRQAIEAAIAELDRRMEVLREARQRLINILDGVASVPRSEDGALPLTMTPGATGPDPSAQVIEQEFHGRSKAEAARIFLQRVGPQKTGTILQALIKGGVKQESKFPDSSLYTTLARHSAFVSLTKNMWDLAERRPDLAQQQREKKRRLTRKSKPPRKRRLPRKGVLVQGQQPEPAGAE